MLENRAGYSGGTSARPTILDVAAADRELWHMRESEMWHCLSAARVSGSPRDTMFEVQSKRAEKGKGKRSDRIRILVMPRRVTGAQ